MKALLQALFQWSPYITGRLITTKVATSLAFQGCIEIHSIR